MDGGAEHGIEAGVGALLRASRLRCGHELHDVAASLRIRRPYLVAIEEGRYDDLPGMAYAVGFVRAYASHLGLDAGEVVRRFKAEAEGINERKDLVFPSPLAEGGIPGAAILFVGVMIFGVAYGAWYVGSARDGFLSDLISPLPDRIAAMVDSVTGSDRTTVAPAPETAPPARHVPDLVAVVEPPDPAATEAGPDAAGEAFTIPETAAGSPQPDAVAAPPARFVAEPKPPVAAIAPEPKPAAVAPPPAPKPVAAAPEPKPVVAPKPEPVAVAAVAEPAPKPVAAAPAPVPAVSDAALAARDAALAESPASKPAPVVAAKPAPVIAAKPAAPEKTDVVAVSEPTPAAVGEQIASVPEAPKANPAAADTAAPVETTASRIVVRARYDSWIQVRDGVHRRLLVTRLLRAGDSYRVPDLPGLTLLTGNAGALEIQVDGESIGAIGEMGKVLRNVALDVERLRTGTAILE